MLINRKNKDILVVDDFILRCAIGKNGIKLDKKEGDKSTPLGKFTLGKLYYRKDRVKKPLTKIPTKIIKKNMGWCDDPHNKYYNKEILINKKIKHEKLFRKDHSYDYFISINYNTKNIKPNKGSAIFIHLTKNYKPTAGCIALKKKDFLILIKLINKKTKIKIY
ncbi:L,D-transpeptidase family protein [Candidatus Pelagibacter sp.]|jgi:L,D-peptidoglycan transpeptidase YkuD (ErfK/YbiS/YcfS/YnhG family)|nr:L,D-transpeptidase family protein [Candidatus Pelagibacter sp.]